MVAEPFCGLFSASKPRPTNASGVPGFILAENAITPEEETALLRAVEQSPAEWTRRRTRITKNYGPYYLYHERDTPEGRFRYTDGKVLHTQLPQFLDLLIMPILRRAIPCLEEFTPNQLHVALYKKGEDHKIRLHNDNKLGTLGPFIVGMCLKSSCDMTFIRPKDGRRKVIHLPKGCVYAMTGESHYDWRHGILSGDTKSDRVSFTLRDVRKLAIEEGVKVTKSRYMPTEQAIEKQREKDMMRSLGKIERQRLQFKLVDEPEELQIST